MSEDNRVLCSQCHQPRWPSTPPEEPYICTQCRWHNEIREGLSRTSPPRPVA